jgi:DNA-binding PadR family transcriptional regulator
MSSQQALAHPSALTAFQLAALRVVEREGPVYGLAIKRALETYYSGDINHGRLYPNLDALVDAGLVTKRARDNRTNEYEATPAGTALLAERREWLGCEEGSQ